MKTGRYQIRACDTRPPCNTRACMHTACAAVREGNQPPRTKPRQRVPENSKKKGSAPQRRLTSATRLCSCSAVVGGTLMPSSTSTLPADGSAGGTTSAWSFLGAAAAQPVHQQSGEGRKGAPLPRASGAVWARHSFGLPPPLPSKLGGSSRLRAARHASTSNAAISACDRRRSARVAA
jgi:hypothetical protein